MRFANNKVTNTTERAKKNPELVLMESIVPNSIERSEKQGQTELCHSELLPVRFMNGKPEDLEKAGVIFGDKVESDPIFQNVTLPKGWEIRPTKHSMWTELVDDKGRVRASIFYKAAFYDRSTHISLSSRYNYSQYQNNEKAVARDGDKIIWESEPFEFGEDGEPTYDSRDVRGKEAEDWLNENYPDWRDVTAYWE